MTSHLNEDVPFLTASHNVGCVADLVGTIARNNPSRIAIDHEDESISYGQLWQRVQKCASALLKLKLDAGSRVAILASNSPEYVEIFLALQLANLVVVPVNYRLSSSEVEYILLNSGAKALFVAETLVPLIAQRRAEIGIEDRNIIILGGDSAASYLRFLAGAPAQQFRPNGKPLAPASIFYTSGTTGFPKGVVLSQLGFLARCTACGWRFGIADEDTVYVPGPLFHQSFMIVALIALCTGGRLVVRAEFRGPQVIEDFRRFKVSWAFLVPNMISTLVEENGTGGAVAGCDGLRAIMSSGSLLSNPLIDAFEASFPQALLSDAYGWTENSWVTYCRHEDLRRIDRSLGRASFGNALSILDEEGRELPAGQAGLVCARSPVPFLGYYQNLEATAAMRRGGWETGGDIGFLDDEGFLHLLDRKRDLIISGGENIYPAEIERVLADHPGILEVAVIGVPDPKWGEHPRICAVPRDGLALSLEDLVAFCDGQLARYKLPKSLSILEALPRNSMGKILRRELREQFWEEPNDGERR